MLAFGTLDLLMSEFHRVMKWLIVKFQRDEEIECVKKRKRDE